MLAIWSLVPLPFLNPAWAYGISQFKYCWRLAWRNYFGGMWGECNWVVVEHSLKSLFLGIARKRPYQSFRHYWVFHICWHIECSTLLASSFRIWNSSTGIPSPPLALFIVILPKVHWTSHSRMSGSRWVTTRLWLSGSLRPFLQLFCVFLPPLFNLFCFC